MKKRLIALVLCGIVMMNCPEVVYAADTSGGISASEDIEAETSGICGENLTWNFANQVLTISGSGEMSNYSKGQAPWSSLLNDAAKTVRLVLGAGVTTIGDYAFYECDSLTEAELPSGCTDLGIGSFGSCDRLERIGFGNSLQMIGGYAFSGCAALRQVGAFPSTLKKIDMCAFGGCASWNDELELPSGLTYVGSYAFMGCEGLNGTLSIPDSVTTIGTGAFNSCSGLIGMRFPESMTKMRTFSGCSSVKKIYFLSETPPELEIDITGTHSFSDLTGLEIIYVPSGCGEAYNTSYQDYLPEKTEIREMGQEHTVHTWGSWETETASTCITQGKEIRRCTIEGCEASEERTLPLTGHPFGDYITTKEATVLKAGVKTRTCQVCGLAETAAIEKLKPVLKLNATSITLKKKQSTTNIKVTNMAKGDKVVSWTSSNTKIVKVSNSGKLTAQNKTGNATVTVKLKSGKSAKIKVKVQSKPVQTTKITGLKKSVTLKKGKKLTLKPTILPITSAEKVTYKSSDKKIVSVTSKGVIRGLKAGKAKITVASGKKKYVVTVTVKK